MRSMGSHHHSTDSCRLLPIGDVLRGHSGRRLVPWPGAAFPGLAPGAAFGAIVTPWASTALRLVHNSTDMFSVSNCRTAFTPVKRITAFDRWGPEAGRHEIPITVVIIPIQSFTKTLPSQTLDSGSTYPQKAFFDVNAFWLEVSCSKLSSSLPFYSTNYRSFIKNHEKVTKLYQLLKSWRRRRLTNENVVQCRPKGRIHPMMRANRAPIRKLFGSFFPRVSAVELPIQWLLRGILLIFSLEFFSKSCSVWKIIPVDQKTLLNSLFWEIRFQFLLGDSRIYAGLLDRRGHA